MNIFIYGVGVVLTLGCVALWAMWLDKRAKLRDQHSHH